MGILTPEAIDFDAYFDEQQADTARVRPASTLADAVVERFHGSGAAHHWQPLGWAKTVGAFDLRPGELTLWTGVNGHGKTTFLSHVMLNVMRSAETVGAGPAAGAAPAGRMAGTVCLASLEMPPAASMAKMTRQAGGTAQPGEAYIRAFHRWTEGRLWIYDHVGRIAPRRMLAIAAYVRRELGVQHLVVDSLMKCGLGSDDYNGQKDFVDGLCAIARDTGLHVHLVCHMRKGEAESKPPDKFDIKGAGEIADLADNIAIVWKNVRKTARAPHEQDPTMPDAFVRIAKQRHHEWEGSWAFHFDKGSQQFLEHHRERPAYIDLPPGTAAAGTSHHHHQQRGTTAC